MTLRETKASKTPRKPKPKPAGKAVKCWVAMPVASDRPMTSPYGMYMVFPTKRRAIDYTRGIVTAIVPACVNLITPITPKRKGRK